jgi:hypothetical protein
MVNIWSSVVGCRSSASRMALSRSAGRRALPVENKILNLLNQCTGPLPEFGLQRPSSRFI